VRSSGWLALALIAPVLASCGGDSEDNSPSDAQKPPPVPSVSTSSTTSTESTPSESTDTTPPSTGPMDQPNPGNGGVPAPDDNTPPADQAQPDSPSHDTPPEPGSPADRFEQFCAKNPGAC
jgi:hypothetical protein